jgi:hypothetical protein
VEHDHSLADQVAVQRPSPAFPPAGAELEETLAQGSRVRHVQVGDGLGEQLDEPRVVCEDADRPAFDLSQHALVDVLDGVRHEEKLADL